MNVSEPYTEPTLFDEAPNPPPLAAADENPTRHDVAVDVVDASEDRSPEAIAHHDRKRLAEQLDALKRKESELRRALAIADHPELADAVRSIEGRAYALSRAEAQLAQGLSKSEARRREVIEKKLGALRDKRSALDTQIQTLESEHESLGSDRLAGFERERQEALEQLMMVLATHAGALSAAGIDANSLVPEMTGWMAELEALAKTLSGARANA